MLWAAATLCFFGFMRSGELTVPSDSAFDPAIHLTMEDITVNDIAKPSMLKLLLKASGMLCCDAMGHAPLQKPVKDVFYFPMRQNSESSSTLQPNQHPVRPSMTLSTYSSGSDFIGLRSQRM